MTVAVVPAVLSLSVANAQSYVTVSGQVSLYQTVKPVAPLGAVKVWEMVLSPLVGVVLPSRAQKVPLWQDRKSTRLNSSHQIISYAVFCLKKKNKTPI